MLNRNVGGLDRLLRAVLAAALSVVAVVAALRGAVPLALAAGAGALGTGFNAVAGWCGVNYLCGVDTTCD